MGYLGCKTILAFFSDIFIFNQLETKRFRGRKNSTVKNAHVLYISFILVVHFKPMFQLDTL